MTAPVIHLVAGPNGAGKSTLYRTVLSPAMLGLPWINADEMVANDPSLGVYEAAGRSFATETVFSHPSKTDLVCRATASGHLVHLHVVIVPVELSVARVALRVEQGGHDVPEDKIRSRHARLWEHVAAAVPQTHETRVYDSSRDRRFRLVATFRRGVSVGATAWPDWAPDELVQLARRPT